MRETIKERDDMNDGEDIVKNTGFYFLSNYKVLSDNNERGSSLEPKNGCKTRFLHYDATASASSFTLYDVVKEW